VLRRVRSPWVSLPPGIDAGRASVDNESAVNETPPTDGKAVSRLLDHCARLSGLADAPPRARERLEAALGGELARRLLGALAGDHRIPARLFVD
jgi:hypothetical protein